MVVSVACQVWTRKKDADIAAKYIGYVNEARFGLWRMVWHLAALQPPAYSEVE